jgi:predicted ATP-binding protein involved in virulence
MSNDCFIENIKIKDIRNIINFDIPLSSIERKHLIITGKNGSGKTSTIVEINNLLNKIVNNQYGQLQQLNKNIENYKRAIISEKNNIESWQKNISIQKEQAGKAISQEQSRINISSYNQNIISCKQNIISYENNIKEWERQIKSFSKVDILFKNELDLLNDAGQGNYLLAYFQSQRKNQPTIPNTITKQTFSAKYNTNPSLSQTFVQYMVNTHTEKMFAKEEGDKEAVKKIDEWFLKVENSFKELFDRKDLSLKFYRKELNYKIEYEDKSFGLNELSDGYSSVLAILTELILRMESKNINAYDMQGIVLIDEIETHLHVELQKRILPFLSSFFPKIQFIVTTHSPFVLSSLSNAIICDLEKKFVTEDLSSYSYDALIESYFDTDKYSSEMKNKIDRFEKLSLILQKSSEEEFEYLKLKSYLKKLPTFMAPELDVKIKELLLKNFPEDFI